MKITITYTNGKEALGTNNFDISDNWEDKMQKRGKELGAVFGIDKRNRSSYNIKYDDKHSNKSTEMNGE